MEAVKDVDKLKENIIIAVGQATPSGFGLDAIVSDLSISCGVLFAFTSRLVALIERVRQSVAQHSSIVTTLSKIRRDYNLVPSSTRARALMQALTRRGGRPAHFLSGLHRINAAHFHWGLVE